METMTVAKVTMAVICMVALLSLSQVEGLTCGQVASSVSGCIPYLQKGGVIPPQCCGGAKKLLGLARTPLDRKQACTCLKSLAGSIKGINLALAGSIPGKCGVRSPFPISLSTDCSKVN